ncbi:hypothetical protein [Candidatus Mycoplasma haematohominis]|uniref:hypothetical protein n=1 Tax=Candidatus Mycoplasma haematohominis TaxID=1494318 RepID=UPI001C0A68FD|nr:hypothetical protein [Candidatus Mycoplasma haemohominis]
MSNLGFKLGGGAVALVIGSATTYGIKGRFWDDFMTTSDPNDWNRVGFKFEDAFKGKVKSTKAATYYELSEEEKNDWEDRFATFWSNSHKIRGERFRGLIITEQTEKVWDNNSHLTKWKDQMDEKIKKTKEKKEMEFMNNFYQECKKVSEFVLEKETDKNYWKDKVREYLGNVSEEEIVKYFRDAWVGCSNNGSSTDIDKNWPYAEKIKDKEAKGEWKDMTRSYLSYRSVSKAK